MNQSKRDALQPEEQNGTPPCLRISLKGASTFRAAEHRRKTELRDGSVGSRGRAGEDGHVLCTRKDPKIQEIGDVLQIGQAL